MELHMAYLGMMEEYQVIWGSLFFRGYLTLLQTRASQRHGSLFVSINGRHVIMSMYGAGYRLQDGVKRLAFNPLQCLLGQHVDQMSCRHKGKSVVSNALLRDHRVYLHIVNTNEGV